MRFKVCVPEEKIGRAGRAKYDRVFVDLLLVAANAAADEPTVLSEEYDFPCNWMVVSGELPDTEDAQRAVTNLMALAQGHPLLDPRIGD